VRQFVRIHLQFQWAAAGPANLTSILPPANKAETKKIVRGLFGPNPGAPLQLPGEIEVLPCILKCTCVNIQWGKWTPNQVPMTITKDVQLLQAGQPPKTFTVTLSIPAKLREESATVSRQPIRTPPVPLAHVHVGMQRERELLALPLARQFSSASLRQLFSAWAQVI